MNTDTIVAIATAVGNAGISIIRVSGKEAISLADQLFRSKKSGFCLADALTHTIHFGHIYEGDELIDEVLVSVMRGPNSYTAEDVVEVNCHGGVTVTRRILKAFIHIGARPAEPGEFTKRAFLNGRIDLSRAEAVIDLIHAKNEMAAKNSVKQLRGDIYDKICKVREQILRDTAFIEAALDDPEHISLDGFSTQLETSVKEEIEQLQALLRGYENGKRMTEGIKTVLLGKPNVGKSSILNLLLGEDRAIVTDIAGTTRDTLEETLQLDGITLNLVDTAGIRWTEDQIEKIGVDKAKQRASEADLILFVADSSVTFTEEDKEILSSVEDRKAVVLLNKTDLTSLTDETELRKYTQLPILRISAKERSGIEQLSKCITDMFFEGKLDWNEELYITNARHQAALAEAKDSLLQVLDSIENQMPEDFFSIDLMNAYTVLGTIIGEAVEEDLINKIFKDFCMGK